MAINKTFKEHAKDRYIERYNLSDISMKKIADMIKNGTKLLYAKRLTTSRSLTYMPVDNEVIKFIFDRKKRKIITILPWVDIFKITIDFFSTYYNNRAYSVTLYPDAYLETKNKNVLDTNIVCPYQDNEKIEYFHPYYGKLFDIAWKNYLQSKEEIDEKNTIKESTIKGKSTIDEFYIPIFIL